MTDVNNDLISSVFVKTITKASTQYDIIGYDESDIISSISTKRHDNLNTNIVVFNEFVVSTITWPAVYGNQRHSYIQIPYRSNLLSSIGVKPNGTSKITYDIIEQPKITLNLTPTADAFVRQGVPRLNYGTSQNLMVGYSQNLNEHYRSLLDFDLSAIPQNKIIDTVTLKIHNSKQNQQPQSIGLSKSSSNFDEYGVTWQNQPYIGDFLKGVVVNQTDQWVSFDVTQYITDCYDGNDTFNGFILKALNDSQDQIVQFESRESSINQPILEVSYYDPTVYSFGNGDVIGSTTIRQSNFNNLNSSLNVKGYWTLSDINSSIRVNIPGTIDTSIAISNPSLSSFVSVRRSLTLDLDSNITTRVIGIDDFDSNITITASNRIGTITIPFVNNLTSNFDVRALGFNNLNSSVYISTPTINSNLYVNPYIYLDGTISIRNQISNDLISNLSISNNELNSIITVVIHDKLDFDSNIIVRRMAISDVQSKVSISRDTLYGDISVGLSSYLDSSIIIRQSIDADQISNVFVLFRSDLQSSIFVTGADAITSSVYVNSGYIKSSIFIPHSGSKYITSDITIKAVYISDMESLLIIGSNKGYVFIM